MSCWLVWVLFVLAAVLVNSVAGASMYPPTDWSNINDCDYESYNAC